MGDDHRSRRSVRTVFTRGDGLVAPAIVLGMVWAVIGTPLALSESDIALRAGGPSAGSALSSLLGLCVTVVAIYLGVRWSLAIPAIIEENLGLRAGLARGVGTDGGRPGAASPSH